MTNETEQRLRECINEAKTKLDEAALLLSLETINPSLQVDTTPELPRLPEQVLTYIGLHELHDKKQLMELFEETDVLYHGATLDPDEVAWCAAFVYAICKKAGYDIPYTLNARAFASIGEESDGKVGDIAVWGSHVATVMGSAPAGTSKIITADEWLEIQDSSGDALMVGGGNQSNMVNISPKDWYDNYSEFIGFRKLV